MAQGVPEPVVRVRVPAKINLSLSVGPIGANGYHSLATVFQAVSLYDELVVEAASPGEFTVTTSGGRVDDDETHLAIRAARLLAQRYADATVGTHISVRKAIPVAGGMAGGSADAAAALLACSVLWNLDVDSDELSALGTELGSDVPFALLGGTAIGTGRGDLLVPALSRGSYHWVIALGWGGLSTPDVYVRFDELADALSDDPGSQDAQESAPEVPAQVLSALVAGDPRALGEVLSNDLQAAAVSLRPDLSRTLDRGIELGAVGAIVSGSGPTCAFLALDESAAVDLSNLLTQSGVCAGVRRVTGPVPGARLIG